jgi:hypothetical protein
MKKLLLLSFVLGFVTIAQAQQPQIVISEIFYDSPNAGTDSLEYIEIYNKGTAAINLKGMYCRIGFKDTLPDFNLAPGKFYVMANNAAYFKVKFGKDCHQWSSGGLNNGGETIDLWTKEGALIDSVRFAKVAPWPVLASNDSRSIVLCNLSADNDNGANWTACSVASKAYIDGKQLFVTPLEENCNGGAVVSAVADAATTTVNKAITIGVLRNDIITQPVTITAVTKASNGTVAITAEKDSVKYTPNKDFCGNDEFSYTISDGSLTSTAKVTISVTGCVVTASIKEMKTLNADGTLVNNGKTYEISAVVNSPNFRPGGLEFPIIDSDGNGIGVFSSAKAFAYTVTEGDVVRVKGKLGQFNGYAQITADTIFKTGTGTRFTPKVVTKLDETTESLIVTLRNVSLVDPAKWVAAGTGFNVEVTDGTNKTIVRIDKDTDLFNASAPKGKFDVTGVGYQFDNATPFTEGYQLYPRYLKDLKLLANNDISLAKFIEIYPNPVQENLSISLNDSFDKILIINQLGQVMNTFEKADANINVNTSNWNKGVYMAIFFKGNSQYSTKIVK